MTDLMITRPKLAIVVSHPIQHFVPFYRRLAVEPGLEVRVFFMSNFSLKTYFDSEMGAEIGWKMNLVSGYDHVFLPEADSIKRSSPLTLNNPSVGRELAEFQPDVVWTHGYNSLTQLRVLRWCRRNQVPLILISDNELVQDRKGWKQGVKAVVLPRLLARYSAFLTTGDNNEDFLRAYGVPDEKLFRSPFTIDEDFYIKARDNRQVLKKQFRDRHNIPADAFLTLTVGKFSPRKRPADLLDVARALKKQTGSGREIFHFLAGDGSERAGILTAAAAENLPVICPGFVNLDELPGAYCAADAIVHPAEADPHPLVMSEAACIGLPVIVSDKVGAVGPSDIVRSGENGIVTPCGDAGAIAQAVRKLATEPGVYEEMSKAALRIFGELDQDRSVAGLLDAVGYCLADRARRGAS